MIDCGAGTGCYGLIRVDVMVETGSIMVATARLFPVPPLASAAGGLRLAMEGIYLTENQRTTQSIRN